MEPPWPIAIARISNPIFGEQCHLIHHPILSRFWWPGLAYICTKVKHAKFRHVRCPTFDTHGRGSLQTLSMLLNLDVCKWPRAHLENQLVVILSGIHK